jgi:lipase chaperone LimK
MDGRGKLLPDRAIRRRFDQLLTLQGEASLEEITAFVREGGSRQLGAGGVRQLLEVWDRYLQLTRKSYATGLDYGDPLSWKLVRSERHRVRHDILGQSWASAFFTEDEQELEALSRRIQAPMQPSVEIDVAALTPAARQRLAQEQEAWRDWERRLALARTEWALLQTRQDFNSASRVAEMEAWLSSRFDAQELRRVRALLQFRGG